MTVLLLLAVAWVAVPICAAFAGRLAFASVLCVEWVGAAWLFRSEWGGTVGPNLLAPLYVLLVLPVILGTPIAIVSQRQREKASRQRTPGSCPACSYDLRASPGRCPECGAPRDGV